jgi:hypothetical protein
MMAWLEAKIKANNEKFEVLQGTCLLDGYPPSQARGHSRRNNSQDERPSGKDGSQYGCPDRMNEELLGSERGLSGGEEANPRGDGERNSAP